MPNPFPGMDPYLEGDLWTSVHTDLCVEIAHQLSPKLRPKYVALTTRRIVVAESEENGGSSQSRYPDVGILGSGVSGTPAGAAVTAPLVLRATLPELIPQVSIEIRDVAQRRLVTCIEVLSPANKNGSSAVEYRNKRFQILASPAHLMEIDLLRSGARFPTDQPLPPVPYFIFVSRAQAPGGRGLAGGP